MPHVTEIVIHTETPKEPRNVFSFLPKFHLQFPFLKLDPRNAEASGKEEAKPTAVAGGEMVRDEGSKLNVVRFPKSQLVVPPPLETEAEQSTKTSNPIILWQVYALGGILVLRWIWGRWNERKAQGRSTTDGKSQRSPSDDDQSPNKE